MGWFSSLWSSTHIKLTEPYLQMLYLHRCSCVWKMIGNLYWMCYEIENIVFSMFFFHLHYYVCDVYYYAYISYVKIKKTQTFQQWLFHLLVFRCPVHLPHLPPWEPSRSFIGDREQQLLSATLEADGLHLASASQRRAVWKLHSTDPLPVWLFRFVWGIQHHLLWWE